VTYTNALNHSRVSGGFPTPAPALAVVRAIDWLPGEREGERGPARIAVGFVFEPVSGGGAQAPFENLVSKLQNPFGPDTKRLTMMAIGAVVGATIIAARYRLPGMPLHPLGFAVASVIQVTWCMLSIFIAWLAKLVIIKLGGLQLFLKARPFFIGLILGQMTGAAMVVAVDCVFFMGQGHSVIRLD